MAEIRANANALTLGMAGRHVAESNTNVHNQRYYECDSSKEKGRYHMQIQLYVLLASRRMKTRLYHRKDQISLCLAQVPQSL